MPHIDDTPPAHPAAPAAQPSTRNRKRGLMPTLSMYHYKPDPELVARVLGLPGKEVDQHERDKCLPGGR